MQRAIPTKPALLHKPVACNAQFRTAHATGWNVEDAARCNAMHTKPKEPTHSGRPSRHARLTKRTQIARLCIRHLPEDRRPICVYPRSSAALWFFGNERTPCRRATPCHEMQRAIPTKPALLHKSVACTAPNPGPAWRACLSNSKQTTFTKLGLFGQKTKQHSLMHNSAQPTQPAGTLRTLLDATQCTQNQKNPPIVVGRRGMRGLRSEPKLHDCAYGTFPKTGVLSAFIRVHLRPSGFSGMSERPVVAQRHATKCNARSQQNRPFSTSPSPAPPKSGSRLEGLSIQLKANYFHEIGVVWPKD